MLKGVLSLLSTSGCEKSSTILCTQRRVSNWCRHAFYTFLKISLLQGPVQHMMWRLVQYMKFELNWVNIGRGIQSGQKMGHDPHLWFWWQWQRCTTLWIIISTSTHVHLWILAGSRWWVGAMFILQWWVQDHLVQKMTGATVSEVRVVSWVFEVVYLQILPNRPEVRFLQPVLVFAQVHRFFFRWRKRISQIKQILDIGNPITHRNFSSCISTSLPFIKLSTRAVNSVTFVPNSSSWSSTLSLRLDWFREVRHVSPRIRAAATANRKPSAMALAPFSIALDESMISS